MISLKFPIIKIKNCNIDLIMHLIFFKKKEKLRQQREKNQNYSKLGMGIIELE